MAKTSTDQASRKVCLRHATAFQKIITNASGSWQAKVARIGRCLALLSGRQWDEFYSEATKTLAAINDYENESSDGFRYFLKATGINAGDIEPTIRYLLVMGASNEEKLDKAIQYAEELQSKFPEWSEKNHVARQISQLKNGENPCVLPGD